MEINTYTIEKEEKLFFEFMKDAYCIDYLLFNKNYTKIHGQSIAVLLTITEVEITDKTFLSYDYIDFLKYDTEPYASNFDKGKYLHLSFLGDKGIPFTTLRKNNEENRKKYIRNKFYKIKIEETENDD